MLGSRRAEGSSEENLAAISPLESLLQQAWLQSHRPKLQRRIASAPLPDLLVGRRSGSQQSTSPVVSEVMSAPVSPVCKEGPEKLFFHKSRPNVSTVLIPRFALPELKCYSQKTDIPRSVSLLQWTHPVPGAGNGRSQALKSLGGSPTLSSENRTGKSEHLSGITESGDSSSGSVDFEAQTTPLASYLDAILMDENLEEEKSMVHETSAYQAMAKEISGLIGLESGAECEESDVVDYEGCWEDAESCNAESEICMIEKSSAYQAMAKEIADLISPSSTLCESGATECSNDEICVRDDFRPPDEITVRKIMGAYACVLSKHIADVSINFGNIDPRTSTESDTILMYLDEDWRLYLRSLNQNFTPSSNFDFNRLLCGAGSSKASADNAVASSSCGSLTELLYRYCYTLGFVQSFHCWRNECISKHDQSLGSSALAVAVRVRHHFVHYFHFQVHEYSSRDRRELGAA